MYSLTSVYWSANLGLCFPLLSLWGTCLGESTGNPFVLLMFTIKPKKIISLSNLAREKSVTLAKFEIPRETVKLSTSQVSLGKMSII